MPEVKFNKGLQPATQAQQDYITGLLRSRGVELNADVILKKARLNKNKAGAWIARLLTMPIVHPIDTHNVGVPRSSWPAIPDGRYAIFDEEAGHIKFYIVDTGSGQWEGRRFLAVQAGDERYPIRNKDTRDVIFSAIAQDPQAASILYGRELGKCGVCGRTLTNPDSIERGIGPVCAEAQGW